MVVNWIVKDGKMRGVNEKGERMRRSYEGEKERKDCVSMFPLLSFAWSLGSLGSSKKIKIRIEHRLTSFSLFNQKS